MAYQTLGDVHAGRQFINDVPVHRRGEREREVLNQLKKELLVPVGTELHVQVGDLFDKFKIDNETMVEVADAYIAAAKVQPNTEFILYPGNHDLSRDADKISSFQVFARLVSGIPNIKVLFNPTVIQLSMGDEGIYKYFGFLPWHPFKSSDELAQELVDQYEKLKALIDTKGLTRADGLVVHYPMDGMEAVFCHCDTEDFSGEGRNVVPTKVLEGFTKVLVTGHVHTKDMFMRDGMTVAVTGSMQPYSHGEDPMGERYLTMTLEQMNAVMNRNAEFLRDKYVRLKLAPTEEVTDIPDCMGFKIVSIDAPDGDEHDENIEVSFEEFNTRALFAQALTNAGVSEDITKEVLAHFDENVQ